MGVLMIDKPLISPHYSAYFAGTEEGIVTAAGMPARKPITVLDAITLQVLATAWSLDNGHYLVRNIEAGRKCIIMARDTQRGYEPVAYDWIAPSEALNGTEQAALWRRWTT